MFWAGRTTPNGIVSPIVIVALALVFSKRYTYRSRDYYLGLILLTVSQVVSRMEIVGLVVPVALYGLLSTKTGRSYGRRFYRIALTGTLSALFGICKLSVDWLKSTVQLNCLVISSTALSILIDTYFWNRPLTLWNPMRSSSNQPRGFLWPELEAILFNVVEGKSSEWGVSTGLKAFQ